MAHPQGFAGSIPVTALATTITVPTTGRWALLVLIFVFLVQFPFPGSMASPVDPADQPALTAIWNQWSDKLTTGTQPWNANVADACGSFRGVNCIGSRVTQLYAFHFACTVLHIFLSFFFPHNC
jgi:hypothetical protein